MMVGKQLNLSNDNLLRSEVVAVKNDERSIYRKKPAQGTGLWTSSWREDTQDSDWVEWCRGENFGSPDEQSWFLLTPDKDARIYVIDSYRDLEALLRRFPLQHQWLHAHQRTTGLDANHFIGIDFERMAEAYDGLHLTYEATGRLHLSYPLDMNSWDCESTLWFRWVFTDVERVEVPKP